MNGINDRMRQLACFLLVFALCSSLVAREGMWIPALLESVEDEMKAYGLKLSAEDLYSINQSSIKDAIVHFGGGCTSSIISEQGLLLTNHHCGYSQIQSHSTLENNYLRDGFWAADHSEELPNEGLTATLIVRIEDVTDAMNAGLKSGMDEAVQRTLLAENRKKVEAAATEGTAYEAAVRAFNYGNQFFVIVTETFADVRLVGAPPSSIGKFGGDTDNWVWPRHTGDFSIFRIYASPDNEPAEYSTTNIPYKPKHHLPVNVAGVKDGDFTMVYGFPGRTSVYLHSAAVEYVQEVSNPMRIDMRRNSLALIDAAMLADEQVKIQYAAKQSRISNAYKKWIGQNFGLERNRAIDNKQSDEAKLESASTTYAALSRDLKDLYASLHPMQFQRELFIEYYYYGPEMLRFAERFIPLANDWDSMEASGELDGMINKLSAGADAFFEDYHKPLDRALFAKMTERYLAHRKAPLTATLQGLIGADQSPDLRAKGYYGKSLLTSRSGVSKLLEMSPKKAAKVLKKDPFFRLTMALLDEYNQTIRNAYNSLKDRESKLMKDYVVAQEQVFPNRTFWPDANSTLRLTFGKAEGSAPKDGMEYHFRTTADGILQKYVPGHPDFDLPVPMVELLKKKDYGQWAGSDGELQVCFTGSNHTTGGNSGSPTLNAYGELVGLNFDRSWESTMSDIVFDPSICRNIMVDIRYVMWVVDKYAGAGHLVKELTLVRGKRELPESDVMQEVLEE